MYEITFITKEETNESVKKLIAKYQGEIVKEKILGRKRFAYPIKKETAGYYTTFIFNLDSQQLFHLDKELNMTSDVMRYLLIKFEQSLNEPEEPKDTKKTSKLDKTEEISEEIVEIKDEPKEIIVKEEKTQEIVETIKEEVALENISTESDDEPKIINDETTENIEKSDEDIKTVEEAKEEETKKTKKTLPKVKKEAVSEEERLAKLEEKLDELLKD